MFKKLFTNPFKFTITVTPENIASDNDDAMLEKTKITGEKKKLERFQHSMCHGKPIYTTGDSQEWTYEYTWEDFEAAERYYAGSAIPEMYACPIVKSLQKEIKEYFIKHPEKLLEGERFKDSDLTPDEIRAIIDGSAGVGYCII
ncbi:MAG: hypothetical protein FWD19_01950 [Defluviitaleaceae bacterium]|nr:hypothetical protein [Defluviitaleaceae bacterium]